MASAGHLFRRAGELIADSVAGQAKMPHAVRRLQDAVAVRDQHHDVLDPDAVIEGTALEITDDQPFLPAASSDDPDDRDDRDEIIAAGPDQRADLD